MQEIFKAIPKFEDYQVSNMGNILGKNGVPMKLHFDKDGYCKVSFYIAVRKKAVLMVHRLVMSAFIGDSIMQVDHINGIKDDNRLENLRYCTLRENIIYHRESERNNAKSKYVGVTHRKTNNKWRARICINSKNVQLGEFNTEIEASEAYQKALNNLQCN